MGHLLVQVTVGPENPTKAALGFLVAKQALADGHRVSIFLVVEAVQLLREAVLDSLTGLGTGALRESFDALVAGGARFYVSGLSSKARGLVEADLEGKPAEFVLPKRLVELTFEADRVLCY